MTKGIIYAMTTVVPGLIKIGKRAVTTLSSGCTTLSAMAISML